MIPWLYSSSQSLLPSPIIMNDDQHTGVSIRCFYITITLFISCIIVFIILFLCLLGGYYIQFPSIYTPHWASNLNTVVQLTNEFIIINI